MFEAFLTICLLITFASAAQEQSARSQADNGNTTGWIPEFMRMGRMAVNRCRERSSIDGFSVGVEGGGVMNVDAKNGSMLIQCMAMRTLRAVDRLLERDVIELPFGWRLIKDASNRSEKSGKSLLSNAMRTSFTSGEDMKSEISARLAKLFRTHSFRIPLPKNISDVFEGEGRHRHRHKNDMMGLMLFGSMAMAIIAIPLGFQFLAVLGGKALMLAKLALILTSIQGLKKIATSNFNYGLYHSPPAQRPWIYDRRWQHSPSAPTEQHTGGLLDGFDVPTDPHALDDIRPRIMLRRVGLTEGAPLEHHHHHQREQI